MKRLLAIILSVLSLMCLFGCAEQRSADPFAVFQTEFSADAELSCNGNTSAFTVERSDGAFELRITSPSEASGYVFSFDGEKYVLSFGDITLDCNGQLSSYPKTVRQALTPSADGIISIGTREIDGKTFTLVEGADIKYLFAENGVPYSISGVAEGKAFEMKLTRFQTKAEK